MEKFARPGEFCPNKAYPDYGKLQNDQQKNLVKLGKTHKGVRRFCSQTCGRTFTETTLNNNDHIIHGFVYQIVFREIMT